MGGDSWTETGSGAQAGDSWLDECAEGAPRSPPLLAAGASWPGSLPHNVSASLQPCLLSSTPWLRPARQAVFLYLPFIAVIPIEQRQYLLAGQLSGRATQGGVGDRGSTLTSSALVI